MITRVSVNNWVHARATNIIVNNCIYCINLRTFFRIDCRLIECITFYVYYIRELLSIKINIEYFLVLTTAVREFPLEDSVWKNGF